MNVERPCTATRVDDSSIRRNVKFFKMKCLCSTTFSMRQPARRSRAATTERAAAVTCAAAVDRRVALTLVGSLLMLRAPPSSAEEGEAGIDTFGYAGDAGAETLNTCSMNKVSCISTLNDDEAHFAAPWEFESTTDDAVAQLCRVVEGGDFEAAVTGVSKLDAAGYIAKSTIAVFSDPFPKERGVLPERPKIRRASADSIVRFRGKVLENEKTPGGSTYVRVRIDGDDATETIDAEFLFLAGDNIVNVRAVSLEQPETDSNKGGKLALSMTQGFVIDKNIARRRMDSLQRALGWQPATVLTDFNPQFNAEVPTVIERVFNPLSGRNAFKPSGIPYPTE